MIHRARHKFCRALSDLMEKDSLRLRQQNTHVKDVKWFENTALKILKEHAKNYELCPERPLTEENFTNS